MARTADGRANVDILAIILTGDTKVMSMLLPCSQGVVEEKPELRPGSHWLQPHPSGCTMAGFHVLESALKIPRTAKALRIT